MTLLIQNSDDGRISSLMEEYMALVPHDTIQNKLEVNNFQIEVARQSGCNSEIQNLICSGYMDMKSIANKPIEKVNIQISTFRMAFNIHMDLKWLIDDINENFDVYDTLPVLEKINAYRELQGSISITTLQLQEPYKSILQKIMIYCKTDAESELMDAMKALSDYQVDLYYSYADELLFVYKVKYGRERRKHTEPYCRTLLEFFVSKDERK